MPDSVVLPLLELEPNKLKFAQEYQTYKVWFNNSILLTSARDPEFAAYRKLLALGHTGKAQTKWRNSPTICFTLDIEKAAKLTTVENRRTGPIINKYKPYPANINYKK